MAIAIEQVTDLQRDFDELATLLEELHEFHMPLRPRDFVENWRDGWRSHISLDNDRLLLLAKEGPFAIGFLGAVIRRDGSIFDEVYCQLEYAYVREPSRRVGVGAALLSQAEAWCRARGISEIRLGVVASNQVGLGFWKRSGFAPLTITMSKSIAGAVSG